MEEYFEKLELSLGGEFDFDHRSKRISFAFTDATLKAQSPVRLERVIEEQSAEVTLEDAKCDYSEAKNLIYKFCDQFCERSVACF